MASPSDEKVGVGLVLKPSATGYHKIVGFMQGSPAELSGQIATTGDLLCEVECRSVHGLEAKEVTKLILCPINSLVTLSVKQDSPGASIRRVTLTRSCRCWRYPSTSKLRASAAAAAARISASSSHCSSHRNVGIRIFARRRQPRVQERI